MHVVPAWMAPRTVGVKSSSLIRYQTTKNCLQIQQAAGSTGLSDEVRGLYTGAVVSVNIVNLLCSISFLGTLLICHIWGSIYSAMSLCM